MKTRTTSKEILNEQLSELDAKLEVMHKARNLLKYKIDTYDSHLAQFNAVNYQRIMWINCGKNLK